MKTVQDGYRTETGGVADSDLISQRQYSVLAPELGEQLAFERFGATSGATPHVQLGMLDSPQLPEPRTSPMVGGPVNSKARQLAHTFSEVAIW